MRARLTSLLLATAWVAGAGCASKPAEEPSAAVDHACDSSPTALQGNDHDSDIDSILTQPTNDPRLAQINRRMYQSLRTLDAELRREQRLEDCERHPLNGGVLQARTSNQQAAGGAAAAAQVSPDAGAPAGVGLAGTAHATAAYAASIRKASLVPGGGGNGATAPKIVPGSDNDIVARRLRKAAEQETNPALRAKLWKEYTDYRQGTSAK